MRWGRLTDLDTVKVRVRVGARVRIRDRARVRIRDRARVRACIQLREVCSLSGQVARDTGIGVPWNYATRPTRVRVRLAVCSLGFNFTDIHAASFSMC